MKASAFFGSADSGSASVSGGRCSLVAMAALTPSELRSGSCGRLSRSASVAGASAAFAVVSDRRHHPKPDAASNVSTRACDPTAL